MDILPGITNMFDSHAHYDDRRFDADRHGLLGSLPAHGVAAVMNAGCDMESSRLGIALAEKYDYIYCAVGTHPHDASAMREGYIERYRRMAAHEKVLAIGEIGLDYHYDHSPRDVQRRVFIEQLELARSLDMPVIVHDREAHADMLAILKEYAPKGVLHCYSGSPEMAREVLKLNMYIGFTGVVTFRNSHKAAEIIKAMPFDRLLAETDCPYMAPEPFRGKRCDSAMMTATLARIAEIKGVSVQEAADITCENARALFSLTKIL